MRAVAIEKMLRAIVEHDDCDLQDYLSHEWSVRNNNLMTKASILLDRTDERAASVIREIMSGGL